MPEQSSYMLSRPTFPNKLGVGTDAIPHVTVEGTEL